MRRRAMESAGKLGAVMVIGGAGVMVGRDVLTADLSPKAYAAVLVIAGVLLVCYSRLQTRDAVSNETFRFGYDLGYEAGYRERGHVERPHVVDLATARTKRSKPAPELADHV